MPVEERKVLIIVGFIMVVGCVFGGYLIAGGHLMALVEPAACIWRSVSPWGTPLAWWTVRLVGADELVPHPVEVAEIRWLSVDEMLADPTLLEGNRPFLEAIRDGRVAV